MKIRQYGITPNPNRVSKSFDKQCGALSWTYRVGVGGSVPSMGWEKTSDSGQKSIREVMDQHPNT